MRRAGLRNVEAFIAMQKGLELLDKAHGDPDLIGLLRQANVYFERVEQLVPTYSLAYQEHSDLYIHLLMNGAAGDTDGVTATADVNEAMARARADYEAAVRNAHTPEERNGTELDLAFISSDWRGMPARVERFAAEKGCSEPSWYPQVSLPFGYAAKIVPRTKEFVVCDPLSSSSWRGAVRAQLFAGDAEAAVRVGRQGSEQAPGEWLSTQLIAAMVALGQFEQAETEVTESLRVDTDIHAMRLMIAAAQGDKAKVARLLQQVRENPQAIAFWGPAPYAWSGDRKGANEVAARVDGHAFGSPALSSLLLWCLCGAPWDLSATPNFAADLKAAGLPWPPVSPIKFPLKDW